MVISRWLQTTISYNPRSIKWRS